MASRLSLPASFGLFADFLFFLVKPFDLSLQPGLLVRNPVERRLRRRSFGEDRHVTQAENFSAAGAEAVDFFDLFEPGQESRHLGSSARLMIVSDTCPALTSALT